MYLTCPNCHTTLEIPDQSYRAEGRNVQCSPCGHKWHFDYATNENNLSADNTIDNDKPFPPLKEGFGAKAKTVANNALPMKVIRELIPPPPINLPIPKPTENAPLRPMMAQNIPAYSEMPIENTGQMSFNQPIMQQQPQQFNVQNQPTPSQPQQFNPQNPQANSQPQANPQPNNMGYEQQETNSQNQFTQNQSTQNQSTMGLNQATELPSDTYSPPEFFDNPIGTPDDYDFPTQEVSMNPAAQQFDPREINARANTLNPYNPSEVAQNAMFAGPNMESNADNLLDDLDFGQQASFAPQAIPNTTPMIRKGPMTAWIILLTMIGGFIIGLISARESLITAYPAINNVYNFIGLGIEDLGYKLEIGTPATSYIIKSNQPRKLVIRGNIKNTSDTVRNLPALMGIIYNSRQENIFQWYFRTDKTLILPGEEIEYYTEVNDPPNGLAEIKVTIVSIDEAEKAGK